MYRINYLFSHKIWIESEVYMKSTGVIRRIDELGRIVIPKEIRKTLRIKEGENLEIYIENETIILKKYSAMKNLNDFAQTLTDSIYSLLKNNIFIMDTDNVIAATGELKKKYLGKPISETMENYISRRDSMLEKYPKKLKITEEEEEGCYAYSSIVANGDAVGMILIFSKDESLTGSEEQIVKIIANFLAKHLEQ